MVSATHIGQLDRRAVEVDVRIAVRFALGHHVLQCNILAGPPVHRGRGALGLHAVEVAHARADVIAVIHRRVGAHERVGCQHLRTAHAGLVIDPVQGELHIEIVTRIRSQVEACRIDLLVTDRLVGEGVLAEAVTIHAGHRHARAQAAVGAADRAADRRLGVELAVVAHGDLGEAFGLGGQAARDVLDRTADGVLAVQRALRTAQNFDARDVEHVQQRPLRAGNVDVVQVDAYAWVSAPGGVGLADAADVGRDRAAGAARRVDGQVGHLSIQVADVLDVHLVQGFGGKGSDCNRHFLQGFLALARGHRDAVQVGRRSGPARRRRALRCVLRQNRPGGQQRADHQAQAIPFHSVLPQGRWPIATHAA
ncbi:hypothetical protein D3C81_1024970 [compost metagenome]